MKHTTLLVIAVCFSCRSYKEKTGQEYSGQMLSQKQEEVWYRYKHDRIDSLRRGWLFWSDTAFSYHPDSGLRASTGYIFMGEQRDTWYNTRYARKEAGREEAEHTTRASAMHSRTSRRSRVVPWVGAILILILLGSCIWHIAVKKR